MFKIEYISKFIERFDIRLSLLVLIYANFLTFQLTGNEELYLGLAKHFMDKEWLPGSFSFNQPFGTRWPYQLCTGFLLQFLSFEPVAFIGRLLLLGLMVFPITRIAKSLKISNFSLLVATGLFIIIHQSFFAHSAIFSGFEPGLCARLFILVSIMYYLERKWMTCFFVGALAVYWHVLAGGWMMAIMGISMLFENEKTYKKLKALGIGMILTFPYLLYLASTSLFNAPVKINSVGLDWIYVYYRNPHHLGLFKNLSYFVSEHLPGVIWLIVAFVLVVLAIKNVKTSTLRSALLIVLVCFSINLFFVLVAAVDHQGHLLKFYPFRSQTFGVFMLMLLGVGFLFKTITVKKLPVLYTGAFIMLLFFSGASLAKGVYKSIWQSNASYNELVDFVKENTVPSDIIAFNNKASTVTLSFSRKTDRKRLAVFKFVPAGGELLYDWYERLMEKEKAFNTLNFEDLKQKYGVDYVCYEKTIPFKLQGTLVFTNEQFCLYKLN